MSILTQRLACTVHADHVHVLLHALYEVCLLILECILIRVMALVACTRFAFCRLLAWWMMPSRFSVSSNYCSPYASEWKPAVRVPRVVTRQLKSKSIHTSIIIFTGGQKSFSPSSNWGNPTVWRPCWGTPGYHLFSQTRQTSREYRRRRRWDSSRWRENKNILLFCQTMKVPGTSSRLRAFTFSSSLVLRFTLLIPSPSFVSLSFPCRDTQAPHEVMLEVEETKLKDGGRPDILLDFSIPPRITFNRPFMLIIYDDLTGLVLLIGRIIDPTDV